jgi:hypothetical protein
MPVTTACDFKDYLNPNSLEILTGCKLEPSLAEAAPQDRFQFERLGYFTVDSADQATPRTRIDGCLTGSWACAIPGPNNSKNNKLQAGRQPATPRTAGT